VVLAYETSLITPGTRPGKPAWCWISLLAATTIRRAAARGNPASIPRLCRRAAAVPLPELDE